MPEWDNLLAMIGRILQGRFAMEDAEQQLVTCLCQHCDGRIEFDAARMQKSELVIECPHCHSYTTIVAPRTTALPPPLPSQLGDKKGKHPPSWRTLAIALGGTFCIISLIAIILVGQRAGPSGPLSDYQVYSTAVDYIKRVHPNAQCGSYSESSITHDGVNFTVTVRVYGVDTVNYGVITRMWVRINASGQVLSARQS